MSGSNKFSKIKQRKGAQDARRSRIYSRISQEIAVAVQQGGNDPADNAQLRGILQKARSENMPGASVRRALQRGANSDAAHLKPAVYEAVGPDSIALMIEVLTDNGNRTTAFVRSTLNKNGATLLRTGSLAHRFDVQGHFDCELLSDPESLALHLMDHGLEDYELRGSDARFITSRENFGAVRAALVEAGVMPTRSALQRLPRAPKAVSAVALSRLHRLLDALMESDDIQTVVHDAVGRP